MNLDTLPWLKPHVDRLAVQIDTGVLPHALLISGPASIGKNLLMNYIKRRLLCAAKSQACGKCRQCKLLKAGTHPDYLHITLEGKKQIVIDQIRGMVEWVSQTSQQGGHKVCVITPAHSMNIQASNSLLKFLEEPPEATQIILISDAPYRLLPTIRSRCQHIVCRVPERKQAVDWLRHYHQSEIETELLLNIANGVPTRAAKVIDDNYLSTRQRIGEALPLALLRHVSPIEIAAGFSDDDPDMVLDIMYHLIADSICYSLSGNSWRNHDLREHLHILATQIELGFRFEFLNRLCRAREILGSQSNANTQMLFEWLLVA